MNRLGLLAAAATIFLGAANNGVAGEGAGDLARGLQHPLASARQTAAETLGDLGPAGHFAVDALLPALRDDSVGVRRAAIAALARVGFEADRADRLLSALSDRDFMVRERAAKLLAATGVRNLTIIQAVVGLLKTEDWSTRRSAAVALSGMSPDLDGPFAVIIAALTDRMLNDEHWQVRSSAAYAIGKHGHRAQGSLPDLFDVLRYDEQMVAEAAIEAIGQVGPSGLDIALTDSFPSVRLGAARIVGALGDRAAETGPALAQAMNERSIAMRRTAAIALGTLGPAAADAVPALVIGLKDADWSVRWASARALGKLGAGAVPAVPVVAEALRDPDSRVCEAAAFALEGIGPAARNSVAALAMAAREQPTDVCQMIDATQATHESQMDLGWTVRWAAARALGAIYGDANQTVAALQAALTDSMWQVRGVAALSLGRVKGGSIAVPLRKALNDDVGAVRKAAAISLAELGRDGRAALPDLYRLQNDPDQGAQDAIRMAIERINAS